MGLPQKAKDWGTAGIGAVMVATAAFGGGANDAYAGEANAQTNASYQQLMSPKEAKELSQDQIVLFYGKNIKDIDVATALLQEQGIPAIAVPGYSKNTEVILLVDQKFKGKYTQDDIWGGVLTVAAKTGYSQELASLKEGSTPASDP